MDYINWTQIEHKYINTESTITVAVSRRYRATIIQFSQHPILEAKITIRKNNVNKISWSKLQHIKDSLGFAHYEAVEFFPPEKEVVSGGNGYHLWVLKRNYDIGFGFKKTKLSVHKRQ